MLTALPALGETDFVYTAMEKGLNMWNSMDQGGGHSARSRQEHKHPEESSVLVSETFISLLSSFVPLWATEGDLGGFLSKPQIILSASWSGFQGQQPPGGGRCGMLAVTPESAPCCEQGQKELGYSSCVCCPNCCPRESCQGRFKKSAHLHTWVQLVRVCVCACADHSEWP